MSAVEVRRFTRDEYERMIAAGIFGPEERVELLDGEILYVAPQKSPHATAVCLAQEALRIAFGGDFHVRGQLPVALDAYSEPEPDLTVVRGEPRDFRDHHPETAVLVVEVADSSLAHDRKRKGSLYARAGVRDYWIVNLVGGCLEVFRDPVRSSAARYGWEYAGARSFSPEESIAPLEAPESPVRVADLLP
jgi:Uma2 family endonuclease